MRELRLVDAAVEEREVGVARAAARTRRGRDRCARGVRVATRAERRRRPREAQRERRLAAPASDSVRSSRGAVEVAREVGEVRSQGHARGRADSESPSVPPRTLPRIIPMRRFCSAMVGCSGFMRTSTCRSRRGAARVAVRSSQGPSSRERLGREAAHEAHRSVAEGRGELARARLGRSWVGLPSSSPSSSSALLGGLAEALDEEHAVVARDELVALGQRGLHLAPGPSPPPRQRGEVLHPRAAAGDGRPRSRRAGRGRRRGPRPRS